MKQYDREYFERWYRSPDSVISPEFRRQRVRLAVAAAEFVLGRRIESVLDVGCGEGLWRAELRRMRPAVRYIGVDSSEYVVQRFGKRRNIREGSLGTLHRMKLTGKFDLVVCADMLEYVPTAELRRGLVTMRKLLHGVAYIEAYATGQEFEGDLEGWHHRSAATYRKAFRDAGLVLCGMNCWIKRAEAATLGAFERCT